MRRIVNINREKIVMDYRYSQEAQEHDLKIIWKCNECGREWEDYPGCNEGGQCFCGGTFFESGESYSG